MMACAPPDDDPDELPPFALGKNLVKLVKYLHNDRGLSVLFIHAHLRSWLKVGGPMPSEELLRCIGRIIQASAHPRTETAR